MTLFLCTAVLMIFSTQTGRVHGKELQKVTLSLQWLTQCQFAGYYVGLEKGYYRQEGIDLTIVPGASDINPIYLVSADAAQFGTKWLADFIDAKAKGFALISIAQILQSNGLIMIAKAQSGIKTPQDFIGKKVGIWFFGNEIQFFTLMNQQGISLAKMHINALKWSIDPFLNGELDVTMAMTYNEYLRVLEKGFPKNEINVINFSDYDLNFPGQVLFTKTDLLKKEPALCEGMLRASLRGWARAMAFPKEAVTIVLKYDQTKTLTKEHQLKQMKEITKLIEHGNHPLGFHPPDQVATAMKILLQHRVISQALPLSNIYTNHVWENARLDHPVPTGKKNPADEAPHPLITP